MCYELAMRYVIRPVASLQELAQVFDLAGAQLFQRRTRHDRRFARVGRRFPADRSLMRVAQDQSGIVGGALAFRTGRGCAAAPLLLEPWTRRAEGSRRDLDELRRWRERRLAAREP